MSWKKAAIYWVLFAILGGYAAMTQPAGEGEVVVKAPREAPLLGAFDDEVAELVFAQDGKRIVAKRDDKTWKLVEPADSTIPRDLVAAFIGSLAEREAATVVAEAADEEDARSFGLVPPKSEIRIRLKDGREIDIQLGGENPPRTAIYARRVSSGEIFLIGLNVQYYAGLMMDSAFGASKAPLAEPTAEPTAEPATEPTPEPTPVDAEPVAAAPTVARVEAEATAAPEAAEAAVPTPPEAAPTETVAPAAPSEPAAVADPAEETVADPEEEAPVAGDDSPVEAETAPPAEATEAAPSADEAPATEGAPSESGDEADAAPATEA